MSDDGPKQVLVIEDDMSLTIALSIRLQNAGYKVTVTHNGTSGIHTALTVNPDLIVLDVQLPDMNGLEVIRRLKAEPVLAEIPVIFMSANITESTKKSAFSAGAVAYIEKPYNPEHLAKTIGRTLAHARSPVEQEAHTT